MPSVLAAEIAQQPEEIARFIDREAAPIRRLERRLPTFSYALIAARGSSDHAALYAQYLWTYLTGIPVVPAVPSLTTLYHRPPRLDDALVIGISQSGQSPDVVAVVEEGRRQGRPTIAITNDAGSPLAKVADHVIELRVSPERSIAATKTYTSTLAAVALLGAALSADQKIIDAVAALPAAARRTLEAAGPRAAEIARVLSPVPAAVSLARGFNLCTAHEIALKLREILRLPTHGFSSADFRHGSIALATAGLAALLVMPAGATFADMHELAKDLRARQASVVAVTGEAIAPEVTRDVLPIADVPEWLSPVVAVLPGQLLAVETALARGVDPDHPAGLTEKVVRTI